MVTKNKIQILVWAVIILLATNLSMVISILSDKSQEKEETNQTTAGVDGLPSERRTRFFMEQLSLTPEQTDKFREYNRNYNQTANQILSELEKLRVEMVGELGLEQPDSTRMDSITSAIGTLHSELKNTTVRYYRQMDKICNPGQRKKLNTIFMSTLHKNENLQPPQQGGRRHRYGKK